tara:strand:+ start:825 stop:1622 length:798 start_codon:yes stop_codon:yes gene_type:complete
MNLVLSGGGLNGIAYISLVNILEKRNILKKINKFAGTSIGSVFIFLISIEANMSEIYNLFIYKFKYIFNININNIIQGCLVNPKIFEEILREILNNKLNKKNITFLEHYNLTKKELNIICTDLYNGTEKLFNINNTPDIDVIDTIIASSSIPIFSKSVKINDNYYIDGSLKNLFPINIFENELDKTIGVLITYPDNYKEKNISTIIKAMLRACMEQNLSDNITNKLLYYIKLPSLLNTVSIHTPIKQKKEAYNLYYKLIENELNK